MEMRWPAETVSFLVNVTITPVLPGGGAPLNTPKGPTRRRSRKNQPPYEEIRDPLLQLIADKGAMHHIDAAAHLTDSYFAEIEDGEQFDVFHDRVYRVATLLVKEGLLDRPKPGFLGITEIGRKRLS